MLDNHPRYFEIAWAAQRSGLYFTCISSKLSAGEIEYIMQDCEAKVLITSAGVGPVIDELPPLLPGARAFAQECALLCDPGGCWKGGTKAL